MKGVKPQFFSHFQMNRISCLSCFYVLLDFCLELYNSANIYIIQLFPEGEVNSGGYIPRREASRYISTTLHLP